MGLEAKKYNNYAAAFVEYCKGMPVEEISQSFGILEQTLRQKISEQKWAVLANQVKEETALMLRGETGIGRSPDKVEARAAVIQENRERNYSLWCELRDEAAEVIHALRAGKLRFKKYWNNKGQIIEKETAPTMNDRTALASYLQMIAMGTYQALGDKGVISGAKMDGIGDNPQGVPQITIVLPGAICAPREERQAQATISI